MTASARLKKLDAPERETGPKSMDLLEGHLMSLMYPDEGGAASAAVPEFADPRGGGRS